MTELLKTGLYHLVEGRHGRFLANPNDIYLGRSMIAYGEFSEFEWKLLEQMVRPGAVVIEAGANMGAFTVPLAKRAGRTGMIYAFEPQLVVFQQLCANIALNDLVNVQAFNAGCGERADWLCIGSPEPSATANFGGLSLAALESESGPKVRVETLDEVIDPARLDLIKADVEGMELAVINGAKGLIRRFRPILYVESHADDAPALIRAVAALDYDLYWHLPPMFNPDNFFAERQNHFGRIISQNMLCVPAERKIAITGARRVAGEHDHPNHWHAQPARPDEG